MAKIDQLVQALAAELAKRMLHKQTQFKSDTLKSAQKVVDEIALLTIEFGVDLHCGLGIWDAYERLNTSVFGVALPVHDELYERDVNDRFDPARVQHFLWKTYCDFSPHSVISPTNEDLEDLAAVVANFLTEKFRRLPTDSDIKALLDEEIKEAGDVKRKLVWLGTRSYLFRTSFLYYTYNSKVEPNVETIDQFVCEEPTRWSGFTPLQLLAEVLNLPQNLKTELLSWDERIQGFFKVTSADKEFVLATNMFDKKDYTIVTPEADKYFADAFVIHGWAIRWDGQWYWSGQQRKYKTFTNEELDEVITGYLAKNYKVAYQADAQKHQKAIEAMGTIYDDSFEYFKTDLGCFANGTELKEKLKAKDTASRQKRAPQITSDGPEYSFPDNVTNCDNGIGFYLNKTEGMELFMGYNDLVAGLQKTDDGITDEEAESIYEFIASQNISPEFVNRLVREYGADNILETFFLDELEAEQAIEYLNRCYKGNYYQKRYPNVSLTGYEDAK